MNDIQKQFKLETRNNKKIARKLGWSLFNQQGTGEASTYASPPGEWRQQMVPDYTTDLSTVVDAIKDRGLETKVKKKMKTLKLNPWKPEEVSLAFYECLMGR